MPKRVYLILWSGFVFHVDLSTPFPLTAIRRATSTAIPNTKAWSQRFSSTLGSTAFGDFDDDDNDDNDDDWRNTSSEDNDTLDGQEGKWPTTTRGSSSNDRRRRNSSSSERFATTTKKNTRTTTQRQPFTQERQPPLQHPSQPQPQETPQPSHFFSRKELQDLAPTGDPAAAWIFDQLCRHYGQLTRPSKIQAMAWPLLRTGQSAIVAEQTGSGKTLAYLIPLLERMLLSTTTTNTTTATNNTRTKEPADAPMKKNAPGTPRIIILAPTAELADQTRAVCEKLASPAASSMERNDYNNNDDDNNNSNTYKDTTPPLFRTLVITASGQYNTNIRDQIRKLQRTPVDVLISTPGRLSTIIRTRNSGLDLSQVQAIVLDEVDILLLDDTFGPQLRTIGQAAQIDQGTQFVFCTATLPDTIVETVTREFPQVQQIRGPGLHKVAPTVKERLIDVSVASPHIRNEQMCFDVKAKQLLQALRETRCRRTLVFCNTVETCRMVENLLKRHDRQGQLYQVGAYHNALTPEARQANLRALARAPGGCDAVLVCTDRAARGVDFGGTAVDHVIVFDFPSDPAEYVRRVGRTARAGRLGTCTVLAYGWQLPIARSVMTKAALQEFKVAEEKAASGSALGSLPKDKQNDDDDDDDNDDDDWNMQQRRKKNNRKPKQQEDMKKSIESGRLWT